MGIQIMSLYQAIEQKKILESKINKIQAYRLCCVRKRDSEYDVSGNELQSVYKNSIEPGYQQSVALIKNYSALKAAINDANARTMITIAGEEMSIATAISRYRSIHREKELYQRMLNNIMAVEHEVEQKNARDLSPEMINRHIESVVGKGKPDADLIDTLSKKYIQDNAVAVFDPLNTREMAERELARLEIFERDIHFELNRANINTEIEVAYAD